MVSLVHIQLLTPALKTSHGSFFSTSEFDCPSRITCLKDKFVFGVFWYWVIWIWQPAYKEVITQ